jgi:uncharacterized membrane protein
MRKSRLEAFSDGVIAIIITIMVLEMKVPRSDSFEALASLVPVFLSYVLSFVYVGIYWNNHHHMLQACHQVTGSMLWANLNRLFWLSLFPFAGLDGRESLRHCTIRALRCGPADGGDRILDTAATDYCITGSDLTVEEGCRQ